MEALAADYDVAEKRCEEFAARENNEMRTANAAHYLSEAGAIKWAARMLRKALASEAAQLKLIQPLRKTCRVDALIVAKWPSPCSPPREIPEAGPGLWSVVALVRSREAGFYDVEFSQQLVDKVPQ